MVALRVVRSWLLALGTSTWLVACAVVLVGARPDGDGVVPQLCETEGCGARLVRAGAPIAFERVTVLGERLGEPALGLEVGPFESFSVRLR
ncbi:MAG: hypothetical protein HZA52_16370 [Planctomycetes bacterium]|nr:hypothetical protein [Planctomycetota bacterium]